jgi:hypothetical protein
MKYFPFLAICSTAFLPTPLEGKTLYLVRYIISNTLDQIFFPTRRDERDCNTLKEVSGLTNAEACRCEGYATLGVSIVCDPMKQQVCMTPSDESFCTSASTDDSLEITETTTLYAALSGPRKRVSFLSPPVQIEFDAVIGTFVNEPEFNNTFQFYFYRAPSSSEYTSCDILNEAYFPVDDDFGFPEVDFCNSCSICDNGVDFKYDCSNANGIYSFNNATNTTELGPGPKIESCIPVADFLPSF